MSWLRKIPEGFYILFGIICILFAVYDMSGREKVYVLKTSFEYDHALIHVQMDADVRKIEAAGAAVERLIRILREPMPVPPRPPRSNAIDPFRKERGISD